MFCFCAAIILGVLGANGDDACDTVRLEFVVPNISQLGVFVGPKVSVKGLNWYASIGRSEGDVDVYLNVEQEKIPGQPYTIKKDDDFYKVVASFKLFQSRYDSETSERPYWEKWLNSVFSWENSQKDIPFISWAELMNPNNQFITRNDEVTLVVEFIIEEQIPRHGGTPSYGWI